MALGFLSIGSPRKQPQRDIPKNVDFIPQAILRKHIGQVAKAAGARIEEGSDNLDSFEGVTFISGHSNVPVAIRHYTGHPVGTTTIYLPFAIRDVDRITEMVASIVEELHFSTDDIYWQRKDDPEL